MADIAWVQLTRYDRATDRQIPTAIQEASLSTLEAYVPDEEDPEDDFYYSRGVRTYARLTDGSQLWLLEEYLFILDLLKVKVKV